MTLFRNKYFNLSCIFIVPLITSACAPGRRDISTDPVAMDFVQNKKVYLSATTSPKRINHIHQMLESIDLTYVDTIFLNLPLKFERDGSEYTIPESFSTDFQGKIKILRPEKDLGPVTKLLPTVEFLKNRGESQAAVITVDDDIEYPIGMMNEMITSLSHHPDQVFAGSTHHLLMWGLEDTAIPPVDGQVSDHNVVEGFAGIGYIVQNVDVDLIKKLSAKEFEKKCFISDDLVISFSLALSNVKRSKIENEFYKVKHLKPFSYGQEADALSKGAGMKEAVPSGFDVESAKYKACHQKLMEFTFNPEENKFHSVESIQARQPASSSSSSSSSS